MGARSESSHIRKIEVLRDEESPLALRGFPHRDIIGTAKPFLGDGFDIMTARS